MPPHRLLIKIQKRPGGVTQFTHQGTCASRSVSNNVSGHIRPPILTLTGTRSTYQGSEHHCTTTYIYAQDWVVNHRMPEKYAQPIAWVLPCAGAASLLSWREIVGLDKGSPPCYIWVRCTS